MNEPLTKEKEIHAAGGSPVLLKKHDVRSAVERLREEIHEYYTEFNLKHEQDIQKWIDFCFPVFKEEKKP